MNSNINNFPCIKIEKISQSVDFIKTYYGFDLNIFESFFILMLNDKNETIGCVKLTQGGNLGTFPDARIISNYATNFLASGLIMIHNKPNTQLDLSDYDPIPVSLLINQLDSLGVSIIDYIVVSDQVYTSFIQRNLLNRDGL